MAHGKGLIRSLNRQGVSSMRAHGTTAPRIEGEPRVCDRCGASYVRRTWRHDRLTHEALTRARWTTCPACRQVAAGEWVGRVLLHSVSNGDVREAVLGRVRNVASRARVTQPERRLVSIDETPTGVEVLTTSQKLAHRIVHELKKAFGGRARYAWDEDGTLLASWACDRIMVRERRTA